MLFKRFSRLAPLLLSTTLLAACAKSPVGEPTIPPVQSVNRLTVTLNTLQAINPAYYYAVAFDDDGNSGDGPAAIISSSFSANGLLGRSFTVLVVYHGGQFIAYRRTSADNNSFQETLDPVAGAFIADSQGRLPSARGTTLSFTLNLDQLANGTRLFRGTDGNGTLPDRLDVNFVATDEIRRDPNNPLRKNFDSLGRTTSSTYATLTITTTQSFTNANTFNEPADDVTRGDAGNNVTLGALEVSNFQIDVQRNRTQ